MIDKRRKIANNCERERERERAKIMSFNNSEDNFFSIKLEDFLKKLLKINESIDENLLLTKTQLNMMIHLKYSYNVDVLKIFSNDSQLFIKNSQSERSKILKLLYFNSIDFK